MGIRFLCPSGHKLNVKSFLAGKRGICPHCGAKFEIPFESVASAPPPPAMAAPPSQDVEAKGAEAKAKASGRKTDQAVEPLVPVSPVETASKTGPAGSTGASNRPTPKQGVIQSNSSAADKTIDTNSGAATVAFPAEAATP